MVLKFLLVSLFCTFSLGQFSAVIRVGEGKLYLYDLLATFLGLSGLVYFLVCKKAFKIPKPAVPFLVFVLVGLVSMFRPLVLYSELQVATSLFYLVRFTTYLLSALVVYNLVIHRLLNREAFCSLLIYSALVVAIVGFVQLVLLPDLGILDTALGWDPHKNRLVSTFFDPNFAGGYLVLAFSYLCFVKQGKHRFVYGTILFAAIVMTFSRSTWGMLALASLIYGVVKDKKVLFVALLLAFLAYFAVPRVQTRLAGITDPTDSARFRLISWNNTLTIAKDHLLLGTGFNTFRYIQKDYGFIAPGTLGGHEGAGSDSSLLFVLATTGIVGFTIFVAGISYPIVVGLRKHNYTLVFVVVPLLAHSQFVNSLFYPPLMFIWLCVVMFAGTVS